MTLQVDRILTLRDHILKPETHFDIRRWQVILTPEGALDKATVGVENRTYESLRHDCGTCACIGGWAEILFSPPNTTLYKHHGQITQRLSNSPPSDELRETSHSVAELLGISYSEADYLCYPPNYGNSHLYPKQRVAETLTRLAETGEVEWN